MKTFLKIFGMSLLLTWAFMWLRGGYISILGLTGFPLSIMFYSITMFLLTYFVLRRYSEELPAWAIVAAMLTGTLSLDVVALALTVNFDYFVRSLPWLSEPFMRIAAIFLGLLFYKISARAVKISVAALSLAFAGWVSYSGLTMYEDKLRPALDATYLAEQGEIKDRPIYYRNGASMSLEQMHKEYVILYFLKDSQKDEQTVAEQFPELQKLYDKYADNPKVGVYAVYCSNDNFTSNGNVIAGEGYTFPRLTADLADVGFFLKDCSLPVAVVFDNNGKGRVYNSSVNIAGQMFEKYIMPTLVAVN